jgi:hypothetical protein
MKAGGVLLGIVAVVAVSLLEKFVVSSVGADTVPFQGTGFVVVGAIALIIGVFSLLKKRGA